MTTQSKQSASTGASSDQIVRAEFEGKPVHVFHFQGRDLWLVSEVGKALEYADKGLSQSLTSWQEVEEGPHKVTLKGKDLKEFKGLLSVVAGSATSQTAALTLLTEAGVNLVLMLTKQPKGVKFRRWLAEELLPRVTRGQLSTTPSNELADVRGAMAGLLEDMRDLKEKLGPALKNPERLREIIHIGDYTKMREEVRKSIKIVANAWGVPYQCIVGRVVKKYAAQNGSWHKIGAHLYEDVLTSLRDDASEQCPADLAKRYQATAKGQLILIGDAKGRIG